MTIDGNGKKMVTLNVNAAAKVTVKNLKATVVNVFASAAANFSGAATEIGTLENSGTVSISEGKYKVIGGTGTYSITGGLFGTTVKDEWCARVPVSGKTTGTASSLTKYIAKLPNLIVLQTMSKAWGSAAIRCGMAFASEEIISIYNKVKYPYNVNKLTQQEALDRLNRNFEVEQWVKLILQERRQLMDSFSLLPICKKVYPTDANFFLAEMEDAQSSYDYLVAKGIIVRNRTRITLCHNCLRITVGTKEENSELLSALRTL